MEGRARTTGRRRKTSRGKPQVPAQPAPSSVSAVDLLIQRLDCLHQRVQKEWKDTEDILAFGAAIRIVRTYFGK